MHSDISRDSYQPDKSFLRVLMQQGRPLLDADFNEQTAIIAGYTQRAWEFLLGPYAAEDINAFRLVNENNRLVIRNGRMMVGGALIQCRGEDGQVDFLDGQPDYDPPDLPENADYLVYVDIFERVVHPAEDDSYVEPALNGADTTLRTRIVWQARAIEVSELIAESMPFNADPGVVRDNWRFYSRLLGGGDHGTLAARVRANLGEDAAPCAIPAESSYRGLANQLYRVEIHTGGPAGEATFKWSHDNGAVVAGIAELDADAGTGIRSIAVTPDALRPEMWAEWTVGSWVELVFASQLRNHLPGFLCRISSIEETQTDRRIVLSDLPVEPGELPTDDDGVLLRKWDMVFDASRRSRVSRGPDNAVRISSEPWLPLEHGLEIAFDLEGNAQYRAGDYWLIPARTTTGDIIWPQDDDQPVPLPPRGVLHAYAPLAVVNANGGLVDLRFILNRESYLTPVRDR